MPQHRDIDEVCIKRANDMNALKTVCAFCRCWITLVNYTHGALSEVITQTNLQKPNTYSLINYSLPLVALLRHVAGVLERESTMPI